MYWSTNDVILCSRLSQHPAGEEELTGGGEREEGGEGEEGGSDLPTSNGKSPKAAEYQRETNKNYIETRTTNTNNNNNTNNIRDK